MTSRFRPTLVIATTALSLFLLTPATGAHAAPMGARVIAAVRTPVVYVSIYSYSFSPATVYVAPGTRVVWTNRASIAHTVTSDSSAFYSGYLRTGYYFYDTFYRPGTYYYHCSIHPSMRGAIVVTAGARRPTAATTTNGSRRVSAITATISYLRSLRPANVSIYDNYYSPAVSNVRARTTVLWTNRSRSGHTVTIYSGPYYRGFSVYLAPGHYYYLIFSRPGAFYYRDALHPAQRGAVIIS